MDQVRNNWLGYNSETRNKLRDLGWEPPRPAREFDSNPNGTLSLFISYFGYLDSTSLRIESNPDDSNPVNDMNNNGFLDNLS
jgi:hypothetical protein